MAGVDAVIAEVGLADHADVAAEKLAPSLQRRLAYGRTIIHAPSVLVLVEPFADCDDATVALLSRALRARAGDTTVLILAHDAAHLTDLCSILYVMEHGRIVEAREPVADAPTTSL